MIRYATRILHPVGIALARAGYLARVPARPPEPRPPRPEADADKAPGQA